MQDYPCTLQELVEWFPSEEACSKYLSKLRWPEGYHCSKCGSKKAWLTRRNRNDCAKCGYPQSITAGTIFHRSHLPLQVWFHAIWWVTSQKSGVSALGLQRALGLGSYKTSWSLLHKLRHVMVRPGRDLLRGNVEVDEIFVGGKSPGKLGRSSEGKDLVVVAAEVREKGKRMGRIRMQHIEDASAKTLGTFMFQNVQTGSIVTTDGWRGYNGLKGRGYRHKRVPGSEVGDQALLSHVHRVSALLKRWFLGTHHGKTDSRYLNEYLNEFVFRFNRRTSRSRGLLFYRMMQNAVVVNPYGYQQIRKPKPANH
ncbi:IS1595 family transposase [bacterium]|nr:IS1595 family transposase [bacterium]